MSDAARHAEIARLRAELEQAREALRRSAKAPTPQCDQAHGGYCDDDYGWPASWTVRAVRAAAWLALGGLAAALLLAIHAYAGTAEIAWDPVPEATGYRVYVGGVEELVTNGTSATVALPDCASTPIDVRAYNAAGESQATVLTGPWAWPRPEVNQVQIDGGTLDEEVQVTVTGSNFPSPVSVDIESATEAAAGDGAGTDDYPVLAATVVDCGTLQITVRLTTAEGGRIIVYDPTSRVAGDAPFSWGVTPPPAPQNLRRTDTKDNLPTLALVYRDGPLVAWSPCEASCWSRVTE